MVRLSCLAVMLVSLAAPAAIAQRLPLDVESYLADDYALMRDLGRCSAFYMHLAQNHELGGWAADAEKRRGHAHEAKLAAEAAFDNVKPPASASMEEVREIEAKIAAYTASLGSIMALETTRQKALAERREINIEQMHFCWRKRIQWIAIETLRKQSIS